MLVRHLELTNAIKYIFVLKHLKYMNAVKLFYRKFPAGLITNIKYILLVLIFCEISRPIRT